MSVALHHRVVGRRSGPTVVVGGSIGCTLDSWNSLLDALGQEFRVIVYDHRGHGGSPAPPGPYTLDELAADVVALLDEWEVERAHFVGLSLGGMVAQHIASHDRDRVDRLVLLCTAAHYDDPASWRERAAVVREGGTEQVADVSLQRWLTADYRREHPSEVQRWRRAIVGVDPEGYAGCCEAIAAMDLRPDLPRIQAPTLVLAGADDPAAPPAQVRDLAASIPGAQFGVVPGAHVPTIDHPDPVNKAIRGHLA
jgi:3-oxoadipate enol-lactonase